jgi:hypothetical protein
MSCNSKYTTVRKFIISQPKPEILLKSNVSYIKKLMDCKENTVIQYNYVKNLRIYRPPIHT